MKEIVPGFPLKSHAEGALHCLPDGRDILFIGDPKPVKRVACVRCQVHRKVFRLGDSCFVENGAFEELDKKRALFFGSFLVVLAGFPKTGFGG